MGTSKLSGKRKEMLALGQGGTWGYLSWTSIPSSGGGSINTSRNASHNENQDNFYQL